MPAITSNFRKLSICSTDSESDFEILPPSQSRQLPIVRAFVGESNVSRATSTRIRGQEDGVASTGKVSQSFVNPSSNESSTSSTESCASVSSPLKTLPLLPKDKIPYDFSDVRVYYCSEELDLDDVDDYDDEDNLKTLRHFSAANGGCINPKIIQILREKEMEINRLLPAQYYISKVLFTKFAEPRCRADVVTLSPTGTGKTLAYLIPLTQFALERRNNDGPKITTPMAMIFVPHQPLAEMVKQRLDQITKGMEIKTAIFTHGHTSAKTDFEIGVCTIGTYSKLFGRSLDDLKTLEYLVIDEADVMLQELSNFKHFKNLRSCSNCRALLFSATSNNYIKEFIDSNNCFFIECGELNSIAKGVVQNFIEVDTEKQSSLYGIAAGNPTLKYFEGPPNPFDAVFLILKSLPKPIKAIIFCKRKVTAEFIAHKLILIGANAAAIHGTFGSKMRNDILEEFAKGKIDVLVATRLITRGVDLDVNIVINYDLPLEVTEYIHRVGRCGRNGNRGVAYTFVDFNNRADYMPSVIRAIALEINKMVMKNKSNGELLPDFFVKKMDTYVADELKKRNLYLRRIQQDLRFEMDNDEL